MKLTDRVERLEAQAIPPYFECEVVFVRPGACEPVRKLLVNGGGQTWLHRGANGHWVEGRGDA